MTVKVIGGYFELELPPAIAPRYPGAIEFQSARAAFLAMLQQLPDVSRVWVPNYICDAMLVPIKSAGKEIRFYSLDAQLEVAELAGLRADEVLLYVNYFGVCTDQARRLLQRANPNQVVMDCSQAFYANPLPCLGTIYSPRKFFGVPDGGLLVTTLSIDHPKVQDQSSEGRMTHLIKRLSGNPESGYADFQYAEMSLDDPSPKGMSNLSKRLLSSVDHDAIRKIRNENFQFIRQHLDQMNEMQLPAEVDGPLCYPYVSNTPISKSELRNNKVYIPTYWPGVLERVNVNSIEANLVSQCIPIPCDQRYSENDLIRVINLITSY